MSSFRSLVAAGVGAVALCVNGACQAAEVGGRVVVSAGEIDTPESPFFVDIAHDVPEHLVALRDEAGGLRPAQIQKGRQTTRLWWIEQGGLKRRSEATYKLVPAGSPPAEPPFGPPRVQIDDDGQRLRIMVGDRPVLDYNQAVVPSPKKDEPYFERSGFIHPVYSPQGHTVTDGMPADHLHQHGLMFAWTNTNFRGHEIDFWNSAERQGRVEHVAVEQLVEGPVFSEVVVRLKHVDTTGSEPVDVLTETWRIRVYAIADPFVIDLESRQEVVGDDPLKVIEYHYGGMMIRGAAEWRRDVAQFLTSEAKDRLTGNHTRPLWVHLSGPAGEGRAGVAAMGHPDNFRFPQPVRLHPEMPYFCFAPLVLGDFSLEPRQPYTSRFRFVVQDGAASSEFVDAQYRTYADPPAARFVPEADLNP